jgi:hypothetical protein
MRVAFAVNLLVGCRTFPTHRGTSTLCTTPSSPTHNVFPLPRQYNLQFHCSHHPPNPLCHTLITFSQPSKTSMRNSPILPQHTQSSAHPIIMSDKDRGASSFEDIELEHFPKHLPLRPQKHSRLLAALKQRPVRAAITIVLFLVTLAGVALGAVFVGKVIQDSKQDKSSTTSPSTTIVTHTSMVTNRPVAAPIATQTTMVVTMTAYASSTPPASSSVAGPNTTVSRTAAVTASPGRQKPGTG